MKLKPHELHFTSFGHTGPAVGMGIGISRLDPGQGLKIRGLLNILLAQGWRGLCKCRDMDPVPAIFARFDFVRFGAPLVMRMFPVIIRRGE